MAPTPAPSAAAPVADGGSPTRSPEQCAPTRSARVASLDAFRGLTILGMLLVNNIALDEATPAQLTHAPWGEGIRFADLVFPWFLLIVGLAIPFSAASARRRGVPAWRWDLRVLTRTALLVLLGCLIDSSIAHRPVFGLGVLQLIGLAYCVGALLHDLPLERRLLIAGGLLVAHWLTIRYMPVPGLGAGIFTERENIISHINWQYLEPMHLRGLVSVVPTAALVLIGAALGELLGRDALSPARKAGRLLSAGIGLLAVGWLWSFDLPFSKSIWTASYVVFAAGTGAVTLGLLHLMMDVNGWRAWAYPLVVLGANAIFAYVVPILTKLWVLQSWTWQVADGSTLSVQAALLHGAIQHAGRIGGGWLYTFGYIAFWWLVTLILYRKRIFLRV